MQSISKFILFNVLGWKVVNGFPKDLNKYLVISGQLFLSVIIAINISKFMQKKMD